MADVLAPEERYVLSVSYIIWLSSLLIGFWCHVCSPFDPHAVADMLNENGNYLGGSNYNDEHQILWQMQQFKNLLVIIHAENSIKTEGAKVTLVGKFCRSGWYLGPDGGYTASSPFTPSLSAVKSSAVLEAPSMEPFASQWRVAYANLRAHALEVADGTAPLRGALGGEPTLKVRHIPFIVRSSLLLICALFEFGVVFLEKGECFRCRGGCVSPSFSLCLPVFFLI